MSQTLEGLAFDRATDRIFQLLTSEQLQKLQDLQYDPHLQTRIEILAHKANEGDLSEDERREYLGYVQANSFFAVVQAQARKHLETKE